MNPPAHTEFPLTRSIYFRAIHVLNRRSRDLWQSDMAALRTAMDLLIESEYSKELENFSNEFADRLVQEGGWELQFFPTYLRDEDDPVHVSHDDVKALLKNWPDPTLQPDGYPDQKFTDIEALEEIVLQRRKNQEKGHPSDGQCYALIALEKVFAIDALLSKNSRLSKLDALSTETLLLASAAAIEAMEMICAAERKLVQEMLPADSADQVRKFESEVQESARRSMAEFGAKRRWEKSPKTAAKQQVKDCWEMWQTYPERYQSKKGFAFDMLSKYEDLENPETILRWCRAWQQEAASSVTIPPAK